VLVLVLTAGEVTDAAVTEVNAVAAVTLVVVRAAVVVRGAALVATVATVAAGVVVLTVPLSAVVAAAVVAGATVPTGTVAVCGERTVMSAGDAVVPVGSPSAVASVAVVSATVVPSVVTGSDAVEVTSPSAVCCSTIGGESSSEQATNASITANTAIIKTKYFIISNQLLISLNTSKFRARH
jgi:hypothetical protein